MNNLDSIQLINGNYNYTFEEIGDVTGFDYAETRLTIEDMAGDQSAEYVASKFGRRRLSWKAVLKEDKIDTITDLQRALKQGNLKTIKFNPYPRMELQADIEIDRFSMPYKNGRRIMLIEAIAPDWRFYSQIQEEIHIQKTIVSGGLDIPADIPFDIYAAINFGNNLQSRGDQQTDPRFTIHGPGTRFTIRNEATGDEFVVDYAMTASDFMVLNKKTGSVILNGIHDVFFAKTGEMWSLQPGNNVITFNPINSGATTLLDIEWRAAYGGF